MTQNQELVAPDLVDLERLGEWMHAQGLPSGAFENQRLLTGGSQNILLYFERGGRAMVLRRPPRHLRATSNRVILREAEALRALAGTAVPHPGYIAHCDDESVLGAAFLLMDPVDGFNPINGLPELHRSDADLRRRMGESLVEALAELGSLDYKSLGLEGFGKPEGYLQRQPSRWRGEMESYSTLPGYSKNDLPHERVIYQWLEDNVPDTFQPGLIHGDCSLANTMFNHDDGELVALIDWEITTIGDPLLDLGWVLATADDIGGLTTLAIGTETGVPTRAEMINHYRRHSHRDLTFLEWYAVLACYKLGAILEGTHARACAGKADVKLGQRLHKYAFGLFERANRWIECGVQTQLKM